MTVRVRVTVPERDGETDPERVRVGLTDAVLERVCVTEPVREGVACALGDLDGVTVGVPERV